MIKANVILDHSKWKKKLSNPNGYIKKKLNKLSKISFFTKKRHEFSILLTNNKRMKSLNFKFRKKKKPTDVLSFPSKNVFKISNISHLSKHHLYSMCRDNRQRGSYRSDRSSHLRRHGYACRPSLRPVDLRTLSARASPGQSRHRPASYSQTWCRRSRFPASPGSLLARWHY